MITQKKRAGIAVVFFTLWLAVLLAGADFPPPRGFIWIILMDAIAAGLAYLRSPTYSRWSATGQRGRILRVLLEGLALGLAFGLITILLPGNGEPSLPPLIWSDYLIWFVVLGAVGAVNALLVYGCCVAMRVRTWKAP